jgi:carboxyl-terminal processing protease
MQGKINIKRLRDFVSKNYIKYIAGAIFVVFVFYLGTLFGGGQLHIFGLSKTNGLSNNLDYSSINEVYNALKNNYYEPLTNDQVLDGIKHGLANSTNDPYTEYFTAKEASDFNSQLNQSITGIGVELGKDSNGNIEVIAPVDGTPASKAGILAKDIITTVNGSSIAGQSIDKVVSEIRGKAGTKVVLEIVRGGNQNLEFTIVRDTINIPTVNYKIINGNIGYMQISVFGDDTSSLATKAAQYFKDNNVKSIVIDLRDNPGGLLDAAVNIASMWLPSSDMVLQEKRGTQVLDTYYSTGDQTLKDLPTAILINGGSASASEILTGALHDNSKAYVIGEQSYGKGVVQQLINLSGGSQLKVTIASWFRPNGQNINKKGITPDQVVKMTQDDINNGKDPQLDAAISYLGTK